MAYPIYVPFSLRDCRGSRSPLCARSARALPRLLEKEKHLWTGYMWPGFTR